MKMIILGAMAALTFNGTASAQQAPQAPMGDISRAAAVRDAEQRFAQLDANGSGTLEADEMRQAFEQRRGERGGPRGGEGARRGGPDGSPQAGQGAGRPRNGGPMTLAQFRARAEQRFDRLDLDRNGVITVAEQKQLRTQRDDRGPGSEK